MKKDKRHIVFTSLVFLLFLFNCQNKTLLNNEELKYLEITKQLNVAIFVNYPPYQFVNPSGKVDGILIDYLNVLETKLNYKFKRNYYYNWQNLISDAEKNKLDVILEIQKTDVRETYLSFTEPIFIGNHVIITKKGSSLNSIKDLKNKSVAVVDEYSIEEYLRDEHKAINVVPFKNEIESLKALSHGDIDAFVALKPSVNYYIKKEQIENVEIKNAIPFKNELGIAITNTKPILIEIINKVTRKISLSEKKEITDKWLYNIVKPYHKKNSFWELLLIITISILFLSFILNYYLKQQVKKRTIDLKKATDIAEKNSQLKTSLLQNISHEIRTPLNSIISLSGFINNNTISESEKTNYLNTITQESFNLKNILTNVVEIADINTLKSTAHFTVFNLNDLLNLLDKAYRHKAEMKDLAFVYTNSIQNNTLISSDKLRLKRALKNILDNAIKFTKKGTVTFSIEQNSNRIKFIITDTGIGIDKEKSNAIFYQFYQIEKTLSKKYDGLGIGLSIAKANINSLGGTIDLTHNLPSGTTFSIVIPFVPAKAINIAKFDQNKNELNILIAEDMKLNYLVLKKILETIITKSHQIIWAVNGKEAIEIINKETIDLVFMDIKMPLIDGFEASKHIKKTHPHIPILAQTAYATEREYNIAMSIGFTDYLTKPINKDALETALKNLSII